MVSTIPGRGVLAEAVAALPEYASAMGLPPPSQDTLATARSVVEALPAGWPPRLATDDEGCVLIRLAGDEGGGVGLTVHGRIVHATLRPGSASRHLDPFVWTGTWPEPLSESLARVGRTGRA